jgi:hypothetical protein
LCEAAEDAKMKMPTALNDIDIKDWYENAFPGFVNSIRKVDPFVISNPVLEEPKSYFVAPFDKDRLKEYVNHDQPDVFFTPAERGRLVFRILENTKFGEGDLDLGVYKMVHNGIFIDCFPLHDGPPKKNNDLPPSNMRQKLEHDWARWARIMKYQPIGNIKEYFGEKFALYFAWLGVYTTCLVPAALVGLLCFIYGVGSTFNFKPVLDACSKDKMFYMCPQCDKLCNYYPLSNQCKYAWVTHFFDNKRLYSLRCLCPCGRQCSLSTGRENRFHLRTSGIRWISKKMRKQHDRNISPESPS